MRGSTGPLQLLLPSNPVSEIYRRLAVNKFIDDTNQSILGNVIIDAGWQ
jgi:hypothetical protein